MKIKKTFQGELPENRVVNAKSNSATDAYSANYLNDKLNKVVVSPTEPITGEDVWIKRSSNILKFDDFTETVNGITFTMKDQVLYIKGTATAYTQTCYMAIKKTLEEDMTLTQYTSGKADGIIAKAAYTYNGTSYYPNLFSVELDKDTYLNQLYFIISEGSVVDAEVRFQLERGKGTHDWQPVMDKQVFVKNDNGVYEELVKNNLHIGSSQPINGEEVWIQKGKNLIDMSYLRTGVYKLGDGTYVDGADACCTKNFIEINNSKNYILSWGSPSNSQLAYVLYYDENKNYLGNSGTQFSNGSLTLNSYVNYSDVKYVNLRFDTTLSSLTNLQLEEGNTKSTYEPFTRKIHTKNDNGTYEDFYDKTNREVYSLAEQRIGTWIDGKPLYRSIYKLTNLPSTNTDLVDVTNLNIRELTKLYGLINTHNNFTFPMPLQDSDANYSVLFKSGNSIRGRGLIGTGYDAYIVTIVIEYTKTTD